MAYTLIQTQVASSQSTLDFTSGISNTYRNYLIIATGFSNSTASNVAAMVQLSTNGGSSFISTNYKCSYGNTNGLTFSNIPTTTVVNSANISLYNLTSGSGYVSTLSNYVEFDPSAPSIGGVTYLAAYRTANVTVNALRITMANGSNFSGTFSLYSIDN